MANSPPTHTERGWQPGDILHIGFGLLWLGFAGWGLATNGPAWAIAWWALAAGFHLGRMIERAGRCAS